MIFGSMQTWESDKQFMHPVLIEAIDYLAQTDFSQMDLGKYPLKEEYMYTLIMELTTKPRLEASAEKHEQYLDIHYLIKGSECIGWALNNEKELPSQLYDKDNDYALYSLPSAEVLLHIELGNYVVLFPEDIHCPAVCDEKPASIRKVVMKIHRSLFS
jgi:biofilm protein TabA